jgi:anti-anti-sigma regulatory factor
MCVEQYSEEIIVVAIAEGPPQFQIWLREPTGGLIGDLQWLCEEYMDSHVILDLADVGSFDAANYRLMLDLQELVKESNYRFVLCGLSPHLKWQLNCVRLSGQFDMFDTREAALAQLSLEHGG